VDSSGHDDHYARVRVRIMGLIIIRTD
jgi:hypothetical protein